MNGGGGGPIFFPRFWCADPQLTDVSLNSKFAFQGSIRDIILEAIWKKRSRRTICLFIYCKQARQGFTV